MTREFVASLLALPRDAGVEPARALLFDYLCCTVAGRSAESTGRFAAGLADAGGETGPLLDAMVNAAAAHATEYDDLHNGASVHPGCVIFPAALAVAALEDSADHLVLAAVVCGYEAMCRVGRAAQPEVQYRRHLHPTGTTGALGAAAAAARLLDLPPRELAWALGIAATGSTASLQYLADGAWTKRAHPAFAVSSGVRAAYLARSGFRGTEDGITGVHGFLATVSDAPRPGLLLRAETDPLEIARTSIKAHACCRYNHAALDAVMALADEHALAAGDVASVEIGLPSVAVPIVAEPADDKRRPASIVDAQFSLPYGVAVALTDGAAGLAQYTSEAVVDPRLHGLMDRVGCRADPSLDEHFPDQWRAWAAIRTHDGRVLERLVPEAKGDPGNPLSADEALAKAEELTAPYWTRGALEAIWEASMRFGEPGSVAALREAVAAADAVAP